jgi:hypothetical protein
LDIIIIYVKNTFVHGELFEEMSMDISPI